MTGGIVDLVPHLDPELAEGLKLLPPWELTVESLPYLRQFSAVEPQAAPEGFVIDNVTVPGVEGNSDVPVRIYRPATLAASAPALLWMHGGGFVMGNIDTDDLLCLEVAHAGQCVVVSVDYRLAPEAPYPAAFDDCYGMLEWIAGQPGELGARPAKIAVAGISAGGCLAAAVALKARDVKGPELCHQFLFIPVIYDRLITPSAHRIRDLRVWDRETARRSWQMYLGRPNGGCCSACAAPGRAEDLSCLPPATVLVEEFDVLRDEAVEYARRLNDAGVSAALYEYRGAFHGHFGFVPDAAISNQTVGDI
jgi:acetyl esterase/lipase